MVEIRGLWKSYGDNEVLRDLSATLSQGKLYAVIGPSGCGKTTLLRCINRLLLPDRGSVYLRGKDIRGYRAERLRRSVGYVIQNVGLFPHYTVEHNIAVVPTLLKWPSEKIEERVREMISLIGLDPSDYLDKYPAQLSGGEAQRIGVARALAADPEILLMDEPFGAVDPITRDRLQGELLSIQEKLKKTIVFVTHDMDEAIRLADEIIIMRDGRIEQTGSPEEILSAPANKFVRDFVGTDRGLKRLSRFRAGAFAEPGNLLVTINGRCFDKRVNRTDSPSFWVVNEQGEVLGWLDRTQGCDDGTIWENITAIEEGESVVKENSTLKEALSVMLSQGIRELPVVDSSGEFKGVVTLSCIEEVSRGEG